LVSLLFLSRHSFTPTSVWFHWQVDRVSRRRKSYRFSAEVRFTMAEDVRAEMVSTVFQVVVSEGDVVADGDTLVILESMKMEIPVLAEVAGTVTTVGVKVGDVIQQGDLIAVIS
jgi:acetyl-CoA carboxylase biotin carboxyl carrier protein